MIWPALLTTVKVAASAVALICVPAVLLAYLLARRDFWGKSLIETLVALPLVLPPTAVGYLLLSLLAFDGPLGRGSLGFDLGLLLTWKGAVLASAVMAFPLVVRTARVAFEGVDPRLEAVSRTLGVRRGATFARVTLPLAAPGLLGALILGFTRAVGEFGATVIVAGNLDDTRTLSIAIFNAEQAGRTADAQALMWISIALGFVAVLVAERFIRRSGRMQGAVT
jgi:molybdate transport system permease protein